VRVQRSRPLLGTYVTVTLYSSERETGLAAISEAFAEFTRVDRLLSIHRDGTALMQVNQRAGTGPVTVPPELADLLARVLSISRDSGGAFDPTIQPLAELWGFIWKEHRMPSEQELADALPRVDYRKVMVEQDRPRVRFADPGMAIDPGGFGKGYAVDRAIERLRDLGIENAMVRAGGDLRVIGAPPGQDSWAVQLEDPAREGRRVTIPLRNRALSTSGDYENFFEIDGRRYSHLLDPRTGLPVRGVASCTVIADSCLESDTWATALFVMGPEIALSRFGNRFPCRFMTSADSENPAFTELRSEGFPRPIDPANR